MTNQIILTLKKKLEEVAESYGKISVEVQRNAVKEVLQYYVLNFIYHHPKHNKWIMYGGSALRICHDLDRMSVDLDFEIDHKITNDFLNTLKKELSAHFENFYGIDSNILTIKITNSRGITLKFHIARELGLTVHSKQVHVKIDLNHFTIRPKIVTERWPQNEYQLSFVINTYNMSALMASKIAAVFLRGQRGVGKATYEEKGRDIYDLLWYMGKKIVPDLDYLKAKNVDEAKDLRTLFDKLTLKMNDVSNENLKQDLTPLFVDQTYIEDWLKNWRETYMHLLNQYKIYTITTLKKIIVSQDFHTDNFSFHFRYETEEGNPATITYVISDYWVGLGKSVAVNNKIAKIIEFKNDGISDKPELMQLATIFNNKNEEYLNKTNHIMLGDIIKTKIIRLTADHLNTKEQILLNKSALLSCELEDLLK